MKLEPALDEDLRQIADWIGKDPYHQQQAADFWLTGTSGVLACKVVDGIGTCAYVKVEDKGDGIWYMHVQFAPEDEVSPMRMAKRIIEFMKTFMVMAKANNVRYLVTDSISPRLVAFMTHKLEFEPIGDNQFRRKVEA